MFSSGSFRHPVSLNPQVTSGQWYSMTCMRCHARQRVTWDHAMQQIGDNKPTRCLLCQAKGKSGVLIPGPSQTEPERN